MDAQSTVEVVLALVALWIRMEHRMTRLETKIESLETNQQGDDRRRAADAKRSPARSGDEGFSCK